MNKFEAKNVAAENGWSGYFALTNDKYCVDVPTGELIVRLEIGYELSFDNGSDDEAALVLEHYKPSTAHPPVTRRECSFRYMDESSFKDWLERSANELIRIGRERSDEGTLP